MNTLKSRLVVIIGCLLAFLVSAVNAGFVAATQTSVCHMTGGISRIAFNLSSIDRNHLSEFLLVATAMFSFLLGATVSGAAVHHPRIDLERPYGRMITLIGLLLLLAQWLLSCNVHAATGIGALACGMQNALATRYRGIILRTTHLTGLLTDLGVSIGMRLRGYRVSSENLRIPSLLIASFLIGAVVGFSAIYFFQWPVIAIAGSIYVAGGVGRVFFWFRKYRRQFIQAKSSTRPG